MKLRVLGSNSDGNGYVLQSGSGSLLIECGVSVKEIKRALNFNIGNVSAIVSHSHGDHAKSIKQVLGSAIKVYAGAATLAATNSADSPFARVIEPNKTYLIQGFKVKPFEVNHDVPCFGFMIEHPEMGVTVFLTDTYYCDYVFPNVNHFIVECNHDLDILYDKAKPFLRDRIMQSHMSLKTCKDLLLANNLSAVNNVVLIHLSDDNSDEKMFKRVISEVTGKTVHIAVPGLEIEFNKYPI